MLKLSAFSGFYRPRRQISAFMPGISGAVPIGHPGLLFPRDYSLISDMLKTMKYRLRPTKNQMHTLDAQLEECRWVYNHLLAERKTVWEERQESLTYHTQATYS